ncbi:A/G-specific adenine glycosylase [Desulfuribacillus stibiiarsenatis]|uniref:Adenine DNA glycosylase n=1 Tax=Desulfuribacillus stibiiarsenatis TaxID=1390249 RepID=A0A1E5L955_9FIRM|nr:A/G-specific adenine glycosylase [Desulfuribacillus stibiiarsenatis]OEH86656.1 A/G-specific adenine glycosylase [Desulfuribacillus stibiiarsenatis]
MELNSNQMFVTSLLAWYWEHKRELPWREDRNPYKIWVSEIMLQQTRVEAVRSYFEKFMEIFPTVQDLAEATEQEVLKAWEGLGYYSRARNLHKAAKKIILEHSGIMPNDYFLLRSLPGIGEYTAGAIMSIAYNQSFPAVDGNALRVFSRLYCIFEDITKNKTKTIITKIVTGDIPEGFASDFNQSIMDLGSNICIPRTPRCDVCPISSYCLAYQEGQQTALPIKSNNRRQKPVMVASALVYQDNRLLLEQRSSDLLANMWQLPSVECEDEEQGWMLLEEKLIQQVPNARLTKHVITHGEHIFSHLHWYLKVYKVELREDTDYTDYIYEKIPTYLSDEDYTTSSMKWITLCDIDKYPMPKIFLTMLERTRPSLKGGENSEF